NTVTIKAKCFLENKAISETSVAHFEKVKPAAALDVETTSSGLNYKIYDGNWDELPNFSALKETESGSVKNFDIIARKGTDKFAYVFEGLIKIPADAIYKFYTSSDDGSQLFIDEKLVVDNDGLHGMLEKEGQAPLAKGWHKIKVSFFEKSG